MTYDMARLGVAVVAGVLAAVGSIKSSEPTDEEKKKAGWIFLWVAAAVWVFFDALALGALCIGLGYAALKLLPHAIGFFFQVKGDVVEAVKGGITGAPPHSIRIASELMKEIEELKNAGYPDDAIAEYIRWRRGNPSSRRLLPWEGSGADRGGNGAPHGNSGTHR